MFLPLLIILHAILLAFTVVGQAYGTALDQHFGYGKPILHAADSEGREALYYDVPFFQDTDTLNHAHIVNKQITEFGIDPDYKVDLLQEDLLKNEDTIIEYARKLLKQ